MKYFKVVEIDNDLKLSRTTRYNDNAFLRDKNGMNYDKGIDATNKNKLSPSSIYNRIKNSHYVLSYVPKRKLNFPKASSSFLKQYIKKDDTLPLDKALFSFGTGINDKDYIDFRNLYSTRYSQIIDSINYNRKFIEHLSSENQTVFQDIFPKLIKEFEENSKMQFTKIKHDTILDYSQWKEFIISSYGLFNHLNHIITRIFKELVEVKGKNGKAQEKIYALETFYSNKYMKDRPTKKKDKTTVNSLNNSRSSIMDNSTIRYLQLQREDSKKMIAMYRLEEEMKDMTKLLDMNNDSHTLYLQSKQIMEQQKSEIEKLKFDYSNDMTEKVMKLARLTTEIQVLKGNSNELETENEIYKKKLIDIERYNIEEISTAKKIRCLAEKNTEQIDMLCEEIIMWRYLYEKEKSKQ